MRGCLFGLFPGTASRRSLAARGQLRNTFAGPGFCVGLSFLALGGYLIADQLQNPLEAQSVGLLFAAMLIATAITVLFWLLHPSEKARHRGSGRTAPRSRGEETVLIVRCKTGFRNEDMDGDAWGGRYVDHTRIRLHR